MKLNALLLFVGIILVASCSSDPKTQTQKSSVNEHINQIVKPFSDLEKLDTFRVVLTGTKPKDMLLTFSITAHSGQRIYSQNFEGKALIDLYKQTVDLKKEDKQIAFLQQELKMFFEEENFLEPAVTETEEPDQFVPDKGFFAELKQSGLNGFKYRLGQENKVYIAWSTREHKVKIYYKCC
jgi:hypothetical protein